MKPHSAAPVLFVLAALTAPPWAWAGLLDSLGLSSPDSPGVGRRIERRAAEEAGLRAAGRCRNALYIDEVRAALADARGRDPQPATESAWSPIGESASERLTALQSGKEVAGHIGASTLLAVRSQGYEPDGAVYCVDPPKEGGALPDKWFGVSTKDGPVFIVRLAVPHHGRTGRAITIHSESPDGKILAGPFAGTTPEELFACGPGQPHPNGMAGKLFEALSGRAKARSWVRTPACEDAANIPASRARSLPRSADYDPEQGRRMAEASRNRAWGGVGECHKYTMMALEDATKLVAPDDYDISVPGGVPWTPAAAFAPWAAAHPGVLLEKTGLREIATPNDLTEVPIGSLIVYEAGACGFHPRAGHIEILVERALACSDHCRTPSNACFSDPRIRPRVHVYMPVRKP